MRRVMCSVVERFLAWLVSMGTFMDWYEGYRGLGCPPVIKVVLNYPTVQQAGSPSSTSFWLSAI